MASGAMTTFGLNYALDKDLDAQTLYMAIGTGTADAAVTDTALETEGARVALSTNSISGVVWTVEGYFNSSKASGSVITEAGIFDAASSGNMICRQTFVGQSKEIGMHLTHTLTTTLANA